MAQGPLPTSDDLGTLLSTTVQQFQGAAPASHGLADLLTALNKAIGSYAPGGDYASSVLGPTGATGETFPRAGTTFVQNIAVTSGQLNLAALYLPANTVVNNLNCVTGSTASSGVSNNWMCLTDNNRNLLAASASNTSSDLSASTLQTYAVATVAAGAATSFTTAYTGLYYIGFVIAVSTTTPTLAGVTNPSTAITNLTPKLCGTSTGSLTTVSTFPTQFTAITATASEFYGFVS